MQGPDSRAGWEIPRSCNTGTVHTSRGRLADSHSACSAQHCSCDLSLNLAASAHRTSQGRRLCCNQTSVASCGHRTHPLYHPQPKRSKVGFRTSFRLADTSLLMEVLLHGGAQLLDLALQLGVLLHSYSSLAIVDVVSIAALARLTDSFFLPPRPRQHCSCACQPSSCSKAAVYHQGHSSSSSSSSSSVES